MSLSEKSNVGRGLAPATDKNTPDRFSKSVGGISRPRQLLGYRNIVFIFVNSMDLRQIVNCDFYTFQASNKPKYFSSDISDHPVAGKQYGIYTSRRESHGGRNERHLFPKD